VSHIDINGVEMKTTIQIYKEGKYFGSRYINECSRSRTDGRRGD